VAGKEAARQPCFTFRRYGQFSGSNAAPASAVAQGTGETRKIILGAASKEAMIAVASALSAGMFNASWYRALA